MKKCDHTVQTMSGPLTTGSIKCIKCGKETGYIWFNESSDNFKEFESYSEGISVSMDVTDSYDQVSKKVKKVLDKVDLDK